MARHSVPGDRLRPAQLGRAVIYVLVAALSVSLLVAFGYGWKNYRDAEAGLKKLKITSLGTGPKSGSTQAPVHDTHGKSQNILITGLDDRSGLTAAQIKAYHTGSDISLSTDSIMVVHVPADGSKATLVSIPRDTYVTIPGYQSAKINAAYADGYTYTTGTDAQKRAGGADELVKTVKLLTGVTIDHFVEVGFSGFVNISNAIQGVQVNLCHAVDDSYSGLQLSAGVHTIQGVQALEFVRQRHGLPGGDLDRETRQRYFLGAAFRKIESVGVLLSPSKLSGLIKAVDSAIYVDSGFSLQSLAIQMSNLSSGNILGRSIPTLGAATINGSDVIQADPAQVQAFMQKTFYPQPKAPTSSPSTAGSSGSPGASGSSGSSASSSAQASTSVAPVLKKSCIN
jgi:LCP family protein required for cell wall assembly